MSPTSFSLIIVVVVVAIFIGMMVMLEVGRRLGRQAHVRDPESAGKGLGPIVGSMFGLMGLLLAFTFSGAGARFDAKQHLIVDETSAVETAYLRLNLLPASAQPKLRENFRRYLDARLEFYRALPVDFPAAQAARAQTHALQHEIWNQAVEATHEVSAEANANAVTSLVLQSVNEMIDIETTRTESLQIHPPTLVYVMLTMIVLTCSLLAGYETAASKKRNWTHVLAFAIVMAGSILLILDYEYPRFGLIRVDARDRVLIDLRNTMH